MIALTAIYVIALGYAGWNFYAEWTAGEITNLVAALSGLVAALAAGVVAVLSQMSKAKSEERRAMIEDTRNRVNAVHEELVRNTAQTQSAKEELKEAIRTSPAPTVNLSIGSDKTEPPPSP